MGDMADMNMYYEDPEEFNGEGFTDIWTKYQKGKLIWTTMGGAKILIENMKTGHVVNTLNYLKGIKKKMSNDAIDEWIDVFDAEIKKRIQS